MDARQKVIKDLCQSPYLVEWLLQLKDNPSLFSLNNLKPCTVSQDGKTRSVDRWDGIQLLICYVSRGFQNQELDAFAVSLINQIIQKIEDDKETNPDLRLDSNYAVLDQLLDILFYRLDYLSEIHFSAFVKIFVNSPNSFLYSLLRNLKDREQEWLRYVSKDDAFSIYKSILESTRTDNDDLDFLLAKNLRNVIQEDPNEFYTYAVESLNKLDDFKFTDMGAFALFPDTEFSRNSKEAVLVSWIRYASCFVSDHELKKDIKRFLDDERRFLKKAALAIIAINFSRLSSLFYEWHHTFFSNRLFASDLIFLIKTNNEIIDKKRLTSFIKEASFGQYYNKILQNHFYGLLKATGEDVEYAQESKEILEDIRNASRLAWTASISSEEEIEHFERLLAGKTFDAALELYLAEMKKSTFFQRPFAQALLKYIDNDFEYIINNIARFDNGLVIETLEHYENDLEKLTKLLIGLSKIKRSEEQDGIVSFLLFKTNRVLQSGHVADCLTILNNLEYRKMPLREDLISNSYLTDCINETFYEFLELYVACINKKPEFLPALKEIVGYGKDHFCQHKFKAVLAPFMASLANLDPEYELALVDYVFSNDYQGYNPSYLTVSLMSDSQSIVLKQIVCRDDFKRIWDNPDKPERDDGASLILFNRFLGLYFTEEDVPSSPIDSFLKGGNTYDLTQSIRTANAYLKTYKSKFVHERVTFFARRILAMIDGFEWNENNRPDFLIGVTSEMVAVSKNSIPEAWALLDKLFDLPVSHLPKEFLTLLKDFQKINRDSVVKLVSKYMDQCEPKWPFKDQAQEVLDLFDDESFKAEKHKWRVAAFRHDLMLA